LKFESIAAVTYLLITKYILKLAGICGFCNVIVCTLHIINISVTQSHSIKLDKRSR